MEHTKKIATSIFILFACVAAHAYDAKIERVISVHDGDTFSVALIEAPEYLRFMSVRINGIDAPEISGKCEQEKIAAIKARDFLKSKLVGDITLKNIKRDKYFRLLADVEASGDDIARLIIGAGHGVVYGGDKKRNWCEK